MEYYLSDTFSPNCFLVRNLKAGEQCNRLRNYCGHNLECIHCSKDSIPVCISGKHYILILPFLFFYLL